MWIASNLGYFSIVKKQGKYFVRARARKDLELLLSVTGLENEILVIPNTDYVARIIVDKTELDLIQRTLFSTIDYDNFKDSIQDNPTQRDKVKHYQEIWGVMFDYQLGRQPFKSMTLGDRIAEIYDENPFDSIGGINYNTSMAKEKKSKRERADKYTWGDDDVTNIKMPKKKSKKTTKK